MPPEIMYFLELIFVLAVLGAVAKGMEGIWRDLGPLAFGVWLLGICWFFGWPLYGHRPSGMTAGEAGVGWFVGLMLFQAATAYLGRRHVKYREGTGRQNGGEVSRE